MTDIGPYFKNVRLQNIHFLLHPLTQPANVPPITHGGRSAHDQALHHTLSARTRRQLYDSVRATNQTRVRQQSQPRLACARPLLKRCRARKRACRPLWPLHPGQHPANLGSARSDGADHRHQYPRQHEPQRSRCHAIRDESLGVLAVCAEYRSRQHSLHPATTGGAVQAGPDDPAQYPASARRTCLASEGR